MRAPLPSLVGDVEVYLQPIVEIATGAVWAFEALARFGGSGEPAADETLARARRAGFGSQLEAECLRAALQRRADLPDGVLLAMNVSPEGLLSAPVEVMWDADLHGVLIEVTEHEMGSDERALRELTRLRERGAAIAVDDAGSGYAGLLRLATLRPDVVKLDRSIVNGARESTAQRAVLETLVAFSHRIDAEVVGEGIENLEDLATLVDFDVDYGQGWAIGHASAAPEHIAVDVVAACQRARAAVLQRSTVGNTAAVRTRHIHDVAGALGRATGLAALHHATAQAAAHLGVDVITASVVDDDGALRAITSSGAAIDTHSYRVADYPATRAVIATGVAVEAHVSDPDGDHAERAVLERLGQASMLMVPLVAGGERIGVLEFVQREHRRWTSTDIANARGLATHLGNALARITA